MRLIISDLASFDLAEIYQWYELTRSSLGEDFTLCVEEAFSVISRIPDGFQKIGYGDSRKYPMHRFPYAIYYLRDKETIYIKGVFHTSGDPSVWQSRLMH